MLTQGFTVCLSSLELLKPGEQGVVTGFRNLDEITTNQIISAGITPGTMVSLSQRYPTFLIKFKNTCVALDKAIVRAICVRVTNDK